LPLYKIENLIYYYPDSQRPAINNINLQVEEGELLLVAGGSGSGKSSLARVLAGLIPAFYGGKFGGKIYFRGKEIDKAGRQSLTREVGMVFQDPEKQLVMTSVEAEIAFGLENLGLPQDEMSRRVAEVMSFLDLAALRQEFTAVLTGGQKQKLALASVLAMQPQVLILDEPTSQLDPVAAEDFFNLVKHLNEELGMTIILIEQRLERCFHLADRVVVMEDGRVIYNGTPEQVARWAAKRKITYVPPVARFFAQIGFNSIPVTVKDGRRLLRSNHFKYQEITIPKSIGTSLPGEPVLTMKNVWFTYPNGTEALQNVNCQITAGEMLAVLGANGSGKTTLLKTMAGLLKPGRGQVQENYPRDGSVAYLPQNPNDYLFKETVEEELLFTLSNFGLKNDGIIDELLERLHLSEYRKANPRDLSSGERQRTALAAVLVTRPQLILLDEPTRGMDYTLKAELGGLLTGLGREGVSVVLVTHDVEFAAEYASRVLLMFNGQIVSCGPKHQIFGQSVFYTTQIGKMCRGYIDGVLTLQEALDKLKPLLAVRPVGSEKVETQILTG